MTPSLEKLTELKMSMAITAFGIALILVSRFALAGSAGGTGSQAEPISWQKEVRQELSKRSSGASIAYVSDWQWRGQEITQINRVANIYDNGKGEVIVDLEGFTADDAVHNSRSQVTASFTAKIKAFVAKRRIQPLEKLDAEMVQLQEVDVTQGMNAEIRGMLLNKDQEALIAKLQTRQTVLENQPLITTAVEKIHDINKGDPVRVKLISGDVILSTPGISSEPGYKNSIIHVLTMPTKKDVVGKFIGDGIVEVRL